MSTDIYWLGSSLESYSRVSTSLALSEAVYAPTAEDCVNWLKYMKDYLYHGIKEILYATQCDQQYLIAFKPNTNEIYIGFRGTNSWKALFASFKAYAIPDKVQGTLHAGYLEQAQLILLAPFCHLLRTYENCKLVFTGHSLGGAIAAIVTLNMLADTRNMKYTDRIFCVAFGAPFVSNDNRSKYMNERYKENFQFYVHQHDVIPYLLTFVYTIRSAALTFAQNELCEKFLSTLAATVLRNEMQNDSLLYNIGRSLSLLPTLDTSECSGLIKNLLESCRSAIETVLPTYSPFGMCYRTKCKHVEKDVADGSQSTGIHTPAEFTAASVFKVKRVTSDQFKVYGANKDPVIAIQDHFLKNYIREIHTHVILKNGLFLQADCEPILFGNNRSSPLYHLVIPNKQFWQWLDTSGKNKNTELYTWSVVSSRYNEQEEITLRLHGPAVSFITGVEIEGRVIATNLLGTKNVTIKPQDNFDECVRLFVFCLPFKPKDKVKLPEDYPIRVISHFGAVNLTGIFHPHQFTSSLGFRGRKKQIADLSVFKLYKQAFSYCAFTSNKKTPTNNRSSDTLRRELIEKCLLFCEKRLMSEYKELEEKIRKGGEGLNKDQLSEFWKDVACGTPKPKKESLAEVFDKESSVAGILSLEQKPENVSPLSGLQFIDVKIALNTWYNNLVDIHSTEVVVDVMPRLFCMTVALIRVFDLFEVSQMNWGKIGLSIIAGALVVFSGGAFLFATLLQALAVAATVAGGSGLLCAGKAIFDYLTSADKEYLKMLLLVAEALGVRVETIRAHQYALEQEISKIYRSMNRSSSLLDEWEQWFPGGVLGKLGLTQKHNCLKFLQCIDAHFQLRELLSKDFAVGVVGPGKTGKSKLIAQMFGFDTTTDQEKRTNDLCSYRVTNEFRVVDFPHSTSSIKKIKNCFQLNYGLVNAIIVVLNAEQTADDSVGEGSVVEMAKEAAKSGVDVLYCFNKCDKLALRKTSDPQQTNEIDEFSQYREGLRNQAYTRDELPLLRSAREVQWTAADVEKKRSDWAESYTLEKEHCWLTFCDLDESDQHIRGAYYKALTKINLRSYLDIKEKWLYDILKQNDLSESSIQEIMSFRYKRA